MARMEDLYEKMRALRNENAKYAVKLDFGEDHNPLYAITITGGRVPEGSSLIRKTMMIDKAMEELLAEYYSLPETTATKKDV